LIFVRVFSVFGTLACGANSKQAQND
jgi:hypothetical protein